MQFGQLPQAVLCICRLLRSSEASDSGTGTSAWICTLTPTRACIVKQPTRLCIRTVLYLKHQHAITSRLG